MNLLLGYRQVNFLRVSGFDALSGAQDLRRGVQASLSIGRGFPRGNADEDLFVSGNIYGGVGSAVSFAGLEVMAEGRRMSTGDWEALLVSGRFGCVPAAAPAPHGGREPGIQRRAASSGCRSSWR